MPYCSAGVAKAAADRWKELGQGWERDERGRRNMQLLGRHGVVHVPEETHTEKGSPMCYCKAMLLLLLRKGLGQWARHEERVPPRAVPLPLSFLPFS